MTVTPTNEPVAINGALSVLTAAGAAYLVKKGIDGSVAQALGALALAELSVWGVFRARAQVTPTAAPKTDTGVPLIPLTAAAPFLPTGTTAVPVVPPVTG